MKWELDRDDDVSDRNTYITGRAKTLRIGYHCIF
jgi:hypothetical protein